MKGGGGMMTKQVAEEPFVEGGYHSWGGFFSVGFFFFLYLSILFINVKPANAAFHKRDDGFRRSASQSWVP